MKRPIIHTPAIVLFTLLLILLFLTPMVSAQAGISIDAKGGQDARVATHIAQATRSGYDGTGIKIAVIDTFSGPNAQHGEDSYLIITNVVSEAEVWQFDDYDATVGTATSATLAAGIDHAVDEGFDLISISQGITTSTCEDPVTVAAKNAIQQGIMVVAGAGNGGPGAQTIISPGCVPAVITVGVTDVVTMPDDAPFNIILSDSSSRGPSPQGSPKPDIVAPETQSWGGSSQATPFVAGTAAMVLQKNPSWNPAQVKNKLQASAMQLPGYTENEVGAGFLDAAKALDLAYIEEIKTYQDFDKNGMPLSENVVQFEVIVRDGEVDHVSWEFGDGLVITEQPTTVLQSYAESGVYIGKVKVYIKDSGFITKRFKVEVKSSEPVIIPEPDEDVIIPGPEDASTLTLTQISNSNDYEFTVDFETSEVVDFLRWHPGSHLYFNNVEVKHYFTLIEDYMAKNSAEWGIAEAAIDHELERFPGKTFWVEYTYWGDIHENEPEPRPDPEYKIEGIVHNVPPGAYSALMNVYVGENYDTQLQSQASFDVESTSARSSDLSAEEVILEVTGISAAHRAGVTGHHWTEIAVIDTFTGSTHGERMVDVIELVAPDASIFRYDVSADDGSGLLDSSKILIALENVLNDNRDIATLSGGIPGQFCNAPDMVEAFTNAIQQGLIITAAAGNGGPGEGTIIPPSCLPYILAVGVAEPIDTVGDEITLDSRSARGPSPLGNTKPDIIAPLIHGNGGTSEANAIMAGSIALYLDLKGAWYTDQYEIMTEFKEAAAPMPGYSMNEVGAGFLDVAKALDIYYPDGESVLSIAQIGNSNDYEFTVNIDTPEEFNLFVFSPPSDLYLNGIKVKDYLGLVDALLPLNHRANTVGMSPEEEWARSNVDQNLLRYPEDIFWIEYTYWGDIHAGEPAPRPAPEYKIGGIVHNIPAGSHNARMDTQIGENYQLLLYSQTTQITVPSTAARGSQILVDQTIAPSFSVVQDTLNSGEHITFQLDVSNIWPRFIPVGTYKVEYSTPTQGVYVSSQIDEIYLPNMAGNENLFLSVQSMFAFEKSGTVAGETEDVFIEAYIENLLTTERTFIGSDTFTLNLGPPTLMCTEQGGAICSGIQVCAGTGEFDGFGNPIGHWIEASDTNSCCSTTCVDITPIFPPTASFYVTPTTGNLGTVFDFTDTSSDSDGTIESWYWQFGDGETSTEQNPAHTYSGGNTFGVTLTTVDNDGGVDFETQFITVSQSTDHPIAQFTSTPTIGGIATIFEFMSTSIAAEDPIIAYIWDFGDGTIGSGATASHIYSLPGIYTVNLMITDDDLKTDTIAKSITVNNRPTASFVLTPSVGTSPLIVAFDDSMTTDEDLTSLTFEYDFGDGTTVSGAAPTHMYTSPGIYFATLTVTDNFGQTASMSLPIEVNVPPVASFEVSPNSGSILTNYHFTDTSTDPDGTIVSWSWQFEEFMYSTQRNPDYFFTAPGLYDVSLVVTDDSGAVNSVSNSVRVYNTISINFVGSNAGKNNAGITLTSPIYGTKHYVTNSAGSAQVLLEYPVDGSETWTLSLDDPAYRLMFPGDANIIANDQPTVPNIWIEETPPLVTVTIQDASGAPVADLPFEFTTQFDSTVSGITSIDGTATVALNAQPLTGAPRTWTFEPNYHYEFVSGYPTTVTVPTETTFTTRVERIEFIKSIDTRVMDFNNQPTLEIPFTLTSENYPDVSSNSRYLETSYIELKHKSGLTETYTFVPGPGYEFHPSNTQTEFMVSFDEPTLNPIFRVQPIGFIPDTEVFTSFNVQGHGYYGWGDCSSQDGTVEQLDAFCQAQGYEGLAPISENPCYHSGSDPGFRWDGSLDPVGNMVPGGNTANGKFTKVMCTGTYTPPANLPPEAAFVSTPLVGSTTTNFQFTSTARDMDGIIASQFWDFGDGTTATSITESHSYTTAGTYTVTLTVTDDDSASATMTQTIFVNNPPVASFIATPTTGEAPLTVLFDSSSTQDEDFNSLTFAYDFGDGSTAIGASSTHTYTSPGNYLARLTVTDNFGETDTRIQTIRVNVHPIAEFTITPAVGSLETNFQFIESSVDVGGFLVAWTWNFGDGEISTQPNPTHLYTAGGNYPVTLTVTDNEGATDSVTYFVSVIEGNHAPAASIILTPLSGDTLTPFRLTDGSTDPDGAVDAWHWELDGVTHTTLQNPWPFYLPVGQHEIRLTVTDNEGATGTTTVQVFVTQAPNQLPIASIILLPPTGDTNTLFQARASSRDPDGTVVAWNWELWNGQTSTQQDPEPFYLPAGQHELRLTITDNDGGTTTETRQVIVSQGANQAPAASFIRTPDIGNISTNFTFTDTSTDADGSVISWFWSFGDGETSTEQNTAHIYSAVGSYTVTLTVTDNNGATDSMSQGVYVNQPNLPPFASIIINPISGGNTNTDYQIFDNSTDSDGFIVAWYWELGRGITTINQTPSRMFLPAGQHEINLTVTDDDGATDTTTKIVVVNHAPANQEPTASIIVAPLFGYTNTSFQFFDNSTDSDGFIVAWYWELGRGITTINQTPSRMFLPAGQHEINLTVTDDDGATDTTTRTLMVYTA